jgi:DNA helicase-2/ATP-dependent DNA helicase PcrA
MGLSGSLSIQSEAREKLGLTSSEGSLRYDQLIPLTLRLFETPGPFEELLKTRWSLVICDEFQDTDDDEWRLLEQLGERARMLLLADPNQMIYGFKRGVSARRLDKARSREGFVEITLPPGSHRDPSQIIPDAASEIRWRRFESDSVARAVSAGKLVVLTNVPDSDRDRSVVIGEQVKGIREAGHESIGIYAKTNSDTAKLSMGLTEQGIDHVPIGFGESYGESLEAMAAMLEFSHENLPWEDVMLGLGVALTASIRSPKPSPLAIALKNSGDLPRELDRRLTRLRNSLTSSRDDVNELSRIISNSWGELGISSGGRAWKRAGRSFAAILISQKSRLGYSPTSVAETVSKLRSESFVDLDAGDQGRVQLMNFHQTKGREADAVILSYSTNDWYGNEGEPYEETSRILYVSMTRARKLVVVLLPTLPHPLVAPFQALMER